MASQDQSQKAVFIYEHPLKLLKQIQAQEGTTVRVERPHPLPLGVIEAEEKRTQALKSAIVRLQDNLEKLRDMQAKIRFMIQELDSSSVKKK